MTPAQVESEFPGEGGHVVRIVRRAKLLPAKRVTECLMEKLALEEPKVWEARVDGALHSCLQGWTKPCEKKRVISGVHPGLGESS